MTEQASIRSAITLRKPLILFCLTAFARSCGYFQEVLFGRAFGASLDADLFFQFLAITFFLWNILFSSASSSFTPQFIHCVLKEDFEMAKAFFSKAIRYQGFWALILVLISLLTQFSLQTYRFGIGGSSYWGLYMLSFLILPMTLSSIFSASLFSLGSYFWPVVFSALGPASAAIGLFSGLKNINYIALILLAGYIAECLLLAAFCLRKNLTFEKIVLPLNLWTGFVKNWWVLVPGSFLQASSEFVNKGVAIYLGIGALASFQYGSKISMSLQSGIAQSMAPLVFTYLSSKMVMNSHEALKRDIQKLMAIFFSFSLVICVCFFYFSEPVIDLLYGRSGSFSSEEILSIVNIQKITLLQLPFFLTGTVGVWAISALKQNWRLTIIASISFVCGILANYILAPRYGVYGVAWASTLSTLVAMVAIFVGILRALNFQTKKADSLDFQ